MPENHTEKFNPNLAGEKLSKTTSGAMFWTGIIVSIVLLPFLVYLAVQLASSGKENCEERIKPYRERNAELIKENASLEIRNHRLDSANRELEKRDLINQFNITQGKKQIILTPKNAEK